MPCQHRHSRSVMRSRYWVANGHSFVQQHWVRCQIIKLMIQRTETLFFRHKPLLYSLYCDTCGKSLQELQKAFTPVCWKTQGPRNQKFNLFPGKIVILWTRARSWRYGNSRSEYFNLQRNVLQGQSIRSKHLTFWHFANISAAQICSLQRYS